MDKMWFFNPGEVACEDCQSHAGYYTSKPVSPHPATCDCLIEEVSTETLAGDGCGFEYRVPLVASSPENGASTTVTFENCANKEVQGAITSAASIENNLGDELQTAVESLLSWSPPDHVTEVHFVAPANTHGKVEVQLVAYVANASVQKWSVCRKQGMKWEHQLDDLSGTYTCIQAIETQVSSKACTGFD